MFFNTLKTVGSNNITVFLNVCCKGVKAWSSVNILYFRNMDADLFMECEEEELEPWQQQNSVDDSVGNAESSSGV